MIQDFDLGNVIVSSETGRTDRIKVNMSLKTIQGGIFDIDKLRRYLGSKTCYPDNNLLFIEPKQHGAFRPAMEVRVNAFYQGKRDPNSNPLFRGNLHFFNQGSVRDKAFLLSFYLDANLSLLARMQGTPQNLNSLKICGAVPPACSTGEQSRDGKDNWILTGKQDTLFASERWGKFTEDALSGIRTRVVDAITEARDAIAKDVFFSGESAATFSPEYLETYWEFVCKNPVATVRNLIEPLTDFAKTIHVTSLRESREGNCHSLSLEIKAGTYLRIYAKTDMRLRFEVAHNLRKNPRLLERKPAGGSKMTQARKVSSIEELTALLEILRKDAAKIVTKALDYVNRKFRAEPSGLDQLGLIIKIFQVISTLRSSDNRAISPEDKEKMTRMILETLRIRGCIHCQNVPEGLKPAVDALKKARILIFDGDSRLYQIFPEGAHALSSLRNFPDSLLTPVSE